MLGEVAPPPTPSYDSSLSLAFKGVTWEGVTWTEFLNYRSTDLWMAL